MADSTPNPQPSISAVRQPIPVQDSGNSPDEGATGNPKQATSNPQPATLLQEFKPTILFLSKFLILYLTLNLSYGLFIDHYSPMPDPVTRWVTEQSTAVLQLSGFDASYSDDPAKPAIEILDGHRAILSIFEGCNGLNVMIIFIAFLLAYGRPSRKLWWFLPLGLLIIHLSNLGRIALLFSVSINLPDFMYFAHKYLFTAIIYIVVFILWYVWLNKLYVDTRD